MAPLTRRRLKAFGASPRAAQPSLVPCQDFKCQYLSLSVAVTWNDSGVVFLACSDKARSLKAGLLVSSWCHWGCPQSSGLIETPSFEVAMTAGEDRDQNTGRRMKIRA